MPLPLLFALLLTATNQLPEFEAATIKPINPNIDNTIGARQDFEEQSKDYAGSFMNLLQSAGLKLTQTKGNIETFVIDSAHPPSPN